MPNFRVNAGYPTSGMQAQGTPSESGNSKLRATCDRCSALKVRCNKQKPTCERCQTLRLQCVYSPFRWKGRPSISASKNNSKPAASLPPSPAITTDKPKNNTPGPEMPPAAAGSDMSTMALTLGSANDDAFFDGVRFPLDDDFTASTLCPDSAAPWMLSTPTPTLSCSENIDWNNTSNSNTTSRSSPVLREQAMPDSSTCVDMALDALCKLHRVPSETSRCRRDSSKAAHARMDMMNVDMVNGGNAKSSSMSTDQAMKANRAALQTMHHVLSRNCPSCAADSNSNLRLLLYTTIARMLTRYRAIFDCIRHYPQNNHHHNYQSSEILYFNPVQFVDFEMDLVTSRRVNSQLLLYEIKSLARFLDALESASESLSSNNGNGGGSAGTPETPSYGFQDAFHQSLTSSVGQLVEEINSLCQTQDKI